MRDAQALYCACADGVFEREGGSGFRAEVKSAFWGVPKSPVGEQHFDAYSTWRCGLTHALNGLEGRTRAQLLFIYHFYIYSYLRRELCIFERDIYC